MKQLNHNNYFLLSAILFLALLVPVKGWTSPKADFSKAWHGFHELRKDESKAKYRSHWLQLKKRFWNAYKQDPDGPYAPKSLYYLGRVYVELGKRSYLKKDFLQAIDYFQRQINNFPGHSWSDDAQLRMAKVQLKHLKDKAQAYIDLLYITHNYPKGDKCAEAKKLLRKLDEEYRQEVGQEVKVEQAEAEKKEKKEKEVKSRKAESKSASKQKETNRDRSLAQLKELVKVRHWSSDEYTRVVLDMDGQTEYEHHLLKPDPEIKKPHRLFIDLQETRLDPEVQEEVKVKDGILKQVRTGQYRKSTSRVVLDIQDLEDFRVFSLQSPFRIVVDVFATKRDSQKRLKKATKSKKDQYELDKKSKSLAGSLVEQLGLKIGTVMIDPGHGGKDPGAVFGKEYEKDINLRMAKILGELLKQEGLKVLYTRRKDVFIPLEERTAMANAQKADLFISIHVNAHKNKRVNGFELYTLNLAKTKDAVRVAARENSVSVKKISDLQVILTDLMLNSKIRESKELAENVHAKTINYAQRFYKDLNDHGVREAPFYVLMGAKMPAILVELGYLTNYKDRKRLKSYAYLKRIAYGLVNGIEAYKEKVEEYANLQEDSVKN